MRLACAAPVLALLCLQSPAAAVEVLVNLSPQRGLPSDAAGLWVLGSWPLQGTVSLPAPLIVQVQHQCQAIAPDPGQVPRTLIVQGYGQCSDANLYSLVLATLSERRDGWGVVLVGSDEAGTALHLSNWASMPNPPFFPGSILTVAKSWGDRLIGIAPKDLNSSTITVRRSVTRLQLDTPVMALVPQGHTTTYTYQHAFVPGGPLNVELTIAVTPTFGDPDLYVSTGADLNQTLNRVDFDRSEVSPGDDVMVLTVQASRPYVVVVVEGADPTQYTMVLSTSESIVPLTNGQPKRYEAQADAYRYFSVSVDQPGEVRFAVTPLTGDPDLFISKTARPTKSDAVWASDEEEGATRLHRYEHVTIPADDPNKCSPLPCTYHLSVLAEGAPSTYSVAVWWGGVPVRLVEGVPQAGEATGPATRQYIARVAGTNADLSLTLTLASGSAKLYANIGTPAGSAPAEHKWSSQAVAGADERLIILHTDANACADCDIRVAVVCAGACEFSLNGKSTSAITVLEDGAPAMGLVNSGSYDYFKLYLSEKSVVVELVLTVFFGNPDLYASVSGGVTMPNASQHDFASEDAASDVIQIPHTNALLAQCQAEQDTCVVYVSVRGAELTSVTSFSLLATAYPVSSAFKVLAPAIVAADYPAYPADFGASLPRSPLSSTIVYAQPGHACAPLLNPERLQGKIALLDRGPRDDEVCPMPHAYFANKIKRVQEADAVAAVVANDRDGDLVYMGAVSGDAAYQVTIPSVFVSKETGDLLKQYVGSVAGGVLAQIVAPAGRVPLLVLGSPQHGVASHSQWRYYEIITPAGSDAVSITVAPDFGNPDVFVSVGTYPDSLHYTWSSENEGADTLTIAGDDPDLCRLCVLVVGVLGRASGTAFTISYASAESLRTLQAGVPLVDQPLTAGTYAWYRLWVGSADTGHTVAVTGRGDVDLYLSFTHERPREESHAYEYMAAGRNDCLTVNCGMTISGGDAIHIPANDLGICAGTPPPCLAYIGVTSAYNTTFTLLISSDASDRLTRLVDGVAVSAAITAAGDYRYYTFSIAADDSGVEAGSPPVAPSVTFSVTPASGDPDLYILGPLSPDDARRPDRSKSGCAGAAVPPAGCGWSARSVGAAAESLVLRPPNASACLPSCIYAVGVYAFSPTAFSITAVSQPATQAISLNVPALGSVPSGGVRRYSLRLTGYGSSTAVVITPFSGDPTLFARFGGPALWSNGSVAGEDVYVSAAPLGIEVLELPPPPASCGDAGDGCLLQLAVRGETASTFSLLTTSPEASSIIALADGQPQAGVADVGSGFGYSFLLLDASRGYSLTLTALDGSPRMLAREGAMPESDSDPETRAGDALHPIEVAATGGASTIVRVYVSVRAGDAAPARWSLLAHGAGGARATLLQDRVPLLLPVPTEVGAGVTFAAVVPADDRDAFLCFTALQGSVTATAEGGSSAGGGAAGAVGGAAGGGFCSPLAAGSSSRITLAADAAQSAPSRVSALLMLGYDTSRSESTAIDLQLGVPQRLRLGAHPERFRLGEAPLSSDAPITFTAAVADGAPAALTLRVLIRAVSRANLTSGFWRSQELGRAYAGAGGVATLTLGTSWDLPIFCIAASHSSRDAAACELLFEAGSSAPAQATVTASSSRSPTLLPLGVAVGGSVLPSGRAHFELLLDSGATADDHVGMQLQRCAGRDSAMPIVSLSTTAPPPVPDQTKFDFKQDGRTHMLPPLNTATKAYLSVDAGGEEFDFLLIAYANPESASAGLLSSSVTGDAGTVNLKYRGGLLSLSFAEPPLPPVEGTGKWVRTYEVWRVSEARRRGANMHAWCGIGRSSELLATSSPAELLRLSGSDKATLRVPLEAEGRELCTDAGECMPKGDPFTLAIVAVSAPPGGGPSRRAVLEPILWRVGHSYSGGGIGFWGGLALALFLAAAGYILQWLARRKVSVRPLRFDRSTWEDFTADTRGLSGACLSTSAKWATAAYTRGRELFVDGVDWARDGMQARGGARRPASAPRTHAERGAGRCRAGQGGDSMTAPLAASAAPMGVGSLPPLSSSDVESARANDSRSAPAPAGSYASPAPDAPLRAAPAAARAPPPRRLATEDDLFAEPVFTSPLATAPAPPPPPPRPAQPPPLQQQHDPLGGASTVTPLVALPSAPPPDVDD